VLRFTPSGSLDPSFGTGGVVTLSSPTVNPTYAEGIELQSTGKIVVIGKSFTSDPHSPTPLPMA
jgi:hypothetical protein